MAIQRFYVDPSSPWLHTEVIAFPPASARRLRPRGTMRLVAFLLFALTVSPVAAAEVDYQRDVKPILAVKCLKCHGGEVTKSGLDLRTRGLGQL